MTQNLRFGGVTGSNCVMTDRVGSTTAGALDAPSKLEPPAAPDKPEDARSGAKLFNPPKPLAPDATTGSGLNAFPIGEVFGASSNF